MGTLNFKESFARSCNRTFSELGNELLQKDRTVLETYVAALGANERLDGKVLYFIHLILSKEKGTTIWGMKKIKVIKSGRTNSDWTERCTYITSSNCQYDGDDCEEWRKDGSESC